MAFPSALETICSLQRLREREGGVQRLTYPSLRAKSLSSFLSSFSASFLSWAFSDLHQELLSVTSFLLLPLLFFPVQISKKSCKTWNTILTSGIESLNFTYWHIYWDKATCQSGQLCFFSCHPLIFFFFSLLLLLILFPPPQSLSSGLPLHLYALEKQWYWLQTLGIQVQHGGALPAQATGEGEEGGWLFNMKAK